ncbi:FG-GAP repeat domain-containing protein [Streptomyces sp. NPDC057494]|uniref:FG-GAP repeat domain-containing protein n=1 Tax=Streptomyces sp. NPDC057494 TaxID=3346148 RepID=UPI0036C8C0B5
MNQHMRTTRHRLTTAIAVALALTAGAAATAAPAAFAAPAAAGQEAEQAVAPFPKGSYIAGAGRTGFLTVKTVDNKTTYAWTRYTDGSTTALAAGVYPSLGQSDIITKIDGPVFTLSDMAVENAEPVVIDTTLLGEGYRSGRAIGPSTVVATKDTTAGADELHIIGKENGTLVDDTVTGLPEKTTVTRIYQNYPGTLTIRYRDVEDTSLGTHVAVVDIAKRAVVETYTTPRTGNFDGDLALSATHIAWIERYVSSPNAVDLVVTRRDTGETKRVRLGEADVLTVELAGDWLLYGQKGGYGAVRPSPRYALTAQSLTSDETVKLLDHFTSSALGPDGTLLVRGGTIAEGEGLYRTALGPDAKPGTELVASTGEPTVLEMASESVPDKVEPGRDGARVPFTWNFSRSLVTASLELTHTATGKTVTLGGYSIGTSLTVRWDATYATNGDYTWRMTAKPANGIGPNVERTGTFTTVREPVPHDFDDNGTPDYLVRDDTGRLVGYNTSAPFPEKPLDSPKPLDTGWNVYDRLVAPGDLGGSPAGDVVAREKDGVLWLHEGTGSALAPRVRIGGGWQIYDKLAGGSDLTSDGRPDLVATDKAGVLWLYKGTGSVTTPFATRTKVGGGWGIYNKIVATGNIGGGPAGDLVARDTAGVLWLYLGKGDGTFATRTRIGGGWNEYKDIISVGDHDRDGRPDVWGISPSGIVRLYRGTGAWRTPFESSAWLYDFQTRPNIVF